MLTHQNEEKGPFLARSQRAFQKLRFLFPAVLRDLKSLDLLSLEYSLFSSNMEAHNRRAYTNHGTIINILISIYPQFQLFGFEHPMDLKNCVQRKNSFCVSFFQIKVFLMIHNRPRCMYVFKRFVVSLVGLRLGTRC